jgi:hypothetical protein
LSWEFLAPQRSLGAEIKAIFDWSGRPLQEREQSVTQSPRHIGRPFRQTKAIRQIRARPCAVDDDAVIRLMRGNDGRTPESAVADVSPGNNRSLAQQT